MRTLNGKGRVEMNLEVPSAIQLEEAYFCLNCEAVTNCSDICPLCGNQQLWCLENWLGRVGGQENSGYGKAMMEEFQPATQETPLNRLEGAIVTGVSTLRKKLLCLV